MRIVNNCGDSNTERDDIFLAGNSNGLYRLSLLAAASSKSTSACAMLFVSYILSLLRYQVVTAEKVLVIDPCDVVELDDSIAKVMRT